MVAPVHDKVIFAYFNFFTKRSATQPPSQHISNSSISYKPCHEKTRNCLCKNKGADQLRSNCEADLCLCFRYTDSTIPTSKISSFQPFSETVQTSRKPGRLVFLCRGSYLTNLQVTLTVNTGHRHQSVTRCLGPGNCRLLLHLSVVLLPGIG